MYCGRTPWPWSGTCWWGVEWEDTGSPDTLVLDQRIELRGFSAGSFAGLSTLQLLWKIPNVVTKGKLGAIACPPQLLVTPPATHALRLLHMSQINYVCGSLAIANWISSRFAIRMLALRALPIRSTLEQGSTAIRIGSRSISRQAGGTLPGFSSCTPMLRAAKRDATPLRLFSWLSFRLETAVEALLEEIMYFALNMTWTHCEVYWDLDLNPLKTSGGQPVDWGASVFGLEVFLAWILIDTIIHPCFKHAVSHVARVCAFGHWNPSSRTPLIMCVLLVNLTTLFVDGFGFEHDLDALWILLGSGFWTLWNQWRAASGIGGFGVWPPFLGFDWSFLFLVTSAFSRRYFVEMPVIPWWHLYPWAFCGLLWPLGVFAWWFVVQSALLWTLPYFVVFVTIMAFMVVQLGCSAFRICFWWFSHHFVVFQQNLDVLDGIWYFGLGRSGFHGCFDDFSLDLNFGLIIFVFRCIWQPWKVPCQICRWKNLQVRRCHAKSAGKKFKVRRCHRNFASKKIFQGEKVLSQICR